MAAQIHPGSDVHDMVHGSPERSADPPLEQSWGESQPTLVLDRVDTRQTLATISNWTAASNTRCHPCRTVCRLISKAGRKLEKAFRARPECRTPILPTIVLHQHGEQITKEDKSERRLARVLLLGSPGSGRSEIIPLMRLVYEAPYTPEEAKTHRRMVVDDLTRGMLRILEMMDKEQLALSQQNECNAKLIRCVGDLHDGDPFPIALRDALASLWSDPSVQAIQKKRDSITPWESFTYFISELDRIFDPSYVPIHEDIIRVEPQPGIPLETSFIYPKMPWRVTFTDTNRRLNDGFEWTHRFLHVKQVVFVIDLTVYNTFIPIGDRLVNQLANAFAAWDLICNWNWPESPTLILFLNKYQLFAHKLKTCNINHYIPSYKGEPQDALAVVQYLTRYLRRRAVSKGRRARIRVTDSMDGVSRRLLGLVICELARECLQLQFTVG